MFINLRKKYLLNISENFQKDCQKDFFSFGFKLDQYLLISNENELGAFWNGIFFYNRKLHILKPLYIWLITIFFSGENWWEAWNNATPRRHDVSSNCFLCTVWSLYSVSCKLDNGSKCDYIWKVWAQFIKTFRSC